jgi:NAD(P)-dependent dehydrogenase (short-subunit alcohol dehydrogenase family)
VSTPELVEVMAINSVAPFVINGRLRPLMKATQASLKFVVNVSAMEGKFYRYVLS